MKTEGGGNPAFSIYRSRSRRRSVSPLINPRLTQSAETQRKEVSFCILHSALENWLPMLNPNSTKRTRAKEFLSDRSDYHESNEYLKYTLRLCVRCAVSVPISFIRSYGLPGVFLRRSRSRNRTGRIAGSGMLWNTEQSLPLRGYVG